jgi:hypothetical protein
MGLRKEDPRWRLSCKIKGTVWMQSTYELLKARLRQRATGDIAVASGSYSKRSEFVCPAFHTKWFYLVSEFCLTKEDRGRSRGSCAAFLALRTWCLELQTKQDATTSQSINLRASADGSAGHGLGADQYVEPSCRFRFLWDFIFSAVPFRLSIRRMCHWRLLLEVGLRQCFVTNSIHWRV